MALLLALMAVAMTTAALWLVCMARFLSRLHSDAPAVYDALGRPVMRYLWWTVPSSRAPAGHGVLVQAASGRLSLGTGYTPGEIRATGRLLAFVLRGDAARLDDPSLRRLGVALRVLFVSFLTDLLLIGVAFGVLPAAAT